jgi:hypothetical protein
MLGCMRQCGLQLTHAALSFQNIFFKLNIQHMHSESGKASKRGAHSCHTFWRSAHWTATSSVSDATSACNLSTSAVRSAAADETIDPASSRGSQCWPRSSEGRNAEETAVSRRRQDALATGNDSAVAVFASIVNLDLIGWALGTTSGGSTRAGTLPSSIVADTP